MLLNCNRQHTCKPEPLTLLRVLPLTVSLRDGSPFLKSPQRIRILRRTNVQEYYFLNNGKKFQHVEVKKSKIKTTLLYYIYSWCHNLIYTKHILDRYTKCFVYVYAVPRRSIYLLIFWFSVSTIWTPSIHLTAPTQPSHQCHRCELRHWSLTGPNWSLRPHLSAVALELFLTKQSGLNLSKKTQTTNKTPPLSSFHAELTPVAFLGSRWRGIYNSHPGLSDPTTAHLPAHTWGHHPPSSLGSRLIQLLSAPQLLQALTIYTGHPSPPPQTAPPPPASQPWVSVMWSEKPLEASGLKQVPLLRSLSLLLPLLHSTYCRANHITIWVIYFYFPPLG